MFRPYLILVLSMTLSCTAGMAYGLGLFDHGTVAVGNSVSDNSDIHAKVPGSQPTRFTDNPGKKNTSAKGGNVSGIAAPMQISLLGEAPLAIALAQTRILRNQMLADEDEKAKGSPTRFFANLHYAQQRFKATNTSPSAVSHNAYLTLGTDVRASDYASTGLAIGIGRALARVRRDGGGYKLLALSGLGYLTVHKDGGYAGVYAQFGKDNFKDSQRVFRMGSTRMTETGKTSGSNVGAGLTGGWWFHVAHVKTGPFVNLEWQNIHVDGYTEKGHDAHAMWFGSQQRKALISTLGWRLQGSLTLHQASLKPFVELAANRDSKANPGNPRKITARSSTMGGRFQMPGFVPDKTWLTTDIGVSAMFNNITTRLAYSGHFNDKHQKYSSINLGLKLGF